jgi:hypothetical protein
VEPANPFSVQIGFGAEAFWWISSAATANGLMVLGMEGAFPAGLQNGQQLAFTRIRARATAPLAGTATITTPFGTFTDAGCPAINTTIDIPGTPLDVPPFSGVITGQPAGNVVTHFFRTAGVVTTPGAPFTGVGAIAAPLPANSVFSIVGCGLNESTNQFTVDGVAFNPGANTAPVATPDAATTGVNTPITIDVAANDTDVAGAGNAYGINPKATAIVGAATGAGVTPPTIVGGVSLTLGPNEPVATALGGKVSKNPDGTLTYTPPLNATGIDTFSYVVQDGGGVITGQTFTPPGTVTGTPAAALVTVTVLRLEVVRAEFRPKLMKWNLNGICTGAADGTVVSIFAGLTADPNALIGTATATAGTWAFEGKSTKSPAGVRTVSVQWQGLPSVQVLGAPLAVR